MTPTAILGSGEIGGPCRPFGSIPIARSTSSAGAG